MMMKELAGKSTFNAGKWTMNCIPLIIPHSYAKLPYTKILSIVLPAADPTTAALLAVANAFID